MFRKLPDLSPVWELARDAAKRHGLRSPSGSLWTESANLAHFNEVFPRGFERLRSNLGYRVRPAWVWQRKRYGTSELIVAVANRGVAGVPGVVWLELRDREGKFHFRGALDTGHPYGGRIRLGSFLLPKGFIGKVKLSAQLEVRPGVFRPVAWACDRPVGSDGSISMDVKPHNDPGWRKNV